MIDRKQKLSTPEIILLGDITIAVTRSARRKTLTVEIDTLGVKIRAPERMRIGTIEKFVHNKRDWIERHYANRSPSLIPIVLNNGAVLKLLNEDFTLRIITQQRGSVQLSDDKITLPIVASKRPLEASIKDKLVKWYKQQALTCLRDKVAFFADEMQINLPSKMNIKVRDYKRRWGSCDHKGDLSFNWRIIMAPESVIDYVTVHELAHLKEFNHSTKFWNIVAEQMTDWQSQQQWLSDHGGNLYRI